MIEISLSFCKLYGFIFKDTSMGFENIWFTYQYMVTILPSVDIWLLNHSLKHSLLYYGVVEPWLTILVYASHAVLFVYV